MNTSTTSKSDGLLSPSTLVRVVTANTPSASPVDAFARHAKVPGHVQAKLERPIGIVGAGGLGSWTALMLARSGATCQFILDHDTVDRTNLPRQCFFADEDLFQPKALRLIENLRPHAIAGGQLTGIALPFEEAIKQFPLPVDVLVVGVDNNACRLAASQWARKRGIPAVFTMLSQDGMRCHCFLQGPCVKDACLWCALPNLNPAEAAACDAGAIISGCMLAASFAMFLTHRALMGWPKTMQPYNFREADLLGVIPDRTGWIAKRSKCPMCKPA
jgi:molybdopterin/thiamine biosynthesis adenylyltransferase